MSFAMAVRFNTTVSAADARMASMAYAQRIAEERLKRSQERSKWYQLSEEERSEILFPAPKKIQTEYYDATPEQTRQVESHFRGEGLHWRPTAESQQVSVKEVIKNDVDNPCNKAPFHPRRPWHAGGGGYDSRLG